MKTQHYLIVGLAAIGLLMNGTAYANRPDPGYRSTPPYGSQERPQARPAPAPPSRHGLAPAPGNRGTVRPAPRPEVQRVPPRPAPYVRPAPHYRPMPHHRPMPHYRPVPSNYRGYWRPGQYVPTTYFHRYAPPVHLVRNYGPPPRGYGYVYNNGELLLVALTTGLIVNILMGY